LPCLKQEPVDLPHTDCGIRIDDRRHINPIGPGLGHESVRLNVIEELLALLSQRLDLLGRIRRNQGLIGRIELLTELICFGSKRDELLFGAFIFSKSGDGLNDFLLIDLRRQIDMEDGCAIFDPRAGLLIEHHDDAGGVRLDLIARDV